MDARRASRASPAGSSATQGSVRVLSLRVARCTRSSRSFRSTCPSQIASSCTVEVAERRRALEKATPRGEPDSDARCTSSFSLACGDTVRRVLRRLNKCPDGVVGYHVGLIFVSWPLASLTGATWSAALRYDRERLALAIPRSAVRSCFGALSFCRSGQPYVALLQPVREPPPSPSRLVARRTDGPRLLQGRLLQALSSGSPTARHAHSQPKSDRVQSLQPCERETTPENRGSERTFPSRTTSSPPRSPPLERRSRGAL